MYLEAVFELLADKVEDDGVYTGVNCCKVHAEVVQQQQETKNQKKSLFKHFWVTFQQHLRAEYKREQIRQFYINLAFGRQKCICKT